MRLLIRKFLQRFGYDIVRLKPVFKPGSLDKKALQSEYQWLSEILFHTIVDIGANEGQFSEKMRILFQDATIYAFEPLKDVFEKLSRNFKKDILFHPVNAGLGSKTEIVEIFRNESSASSSLLEMTDLHTESFVNAVDVQVEKINIDTLDNFFQSIDLKGPVLIKMDVQGFEREVIRGGLHTLSKADMILSEVTFESLYKDQPLFDDIYVHLKELGFSFYGAFEQLHSPINNRILQADAIFIKQK